MAENAYKAYVEFDSSEVDYERPVGADIAHTLLEDATMLAESCGQVRVKAIAPDQDSELQTDETIVADEWHLIFPGRIDVHLHPEAGAFRFRVRLAGRSTAGHTATFRIVIGNPGLVRGQVVESTAGTNVSEYSTTATTSAWLSGSRTLLEVPTSDGVDEAEASLVYQDTVRSIGGSDTIVPVCRLACEVWAKIANASSTPKVMGFIAEEYIEDGT